MSATKDSGASPYPVDKAVALAAGRQVLRTEASALEQLAGGLDQSFVDAVSTLANVTGRVIVSGIGKSGHIGAKIASTLASTGTPAQFVHATEASHGDLGMITKADAVLILSNSGESRELQDLIGHTRRHDIPLIGLSSKADSTLMEHADIRLFLPKAAEACPMGLAPTTSSTMTLALGDALAVALMEVKGFSVDDYRLLHPGGQLGKSLVRVTDIIHDLGETPLVPMNASMREAVLVMTEKRFGCVGIVDDRGSLIGVFTDGDLRRQLEDGLLNKTAKQVMTANPKVIRREALAVEAIALMNKTKITCLFVVDDVADPSHDAYRKPRGIIHMHDCLRLGVA